MPPAPAPDAQVKVRQTLHGHPDVLGQFLKSGWTELNFPGNFSFGFYGGKMETQLEKIGRRSDAALVLVVRPFGAATQWFTPTPDQTLAELHALFKTDDGALCIDISAQPMLG